MKQLLIILSILSLSLKAQDLKKWQKETPGKLLIKSSQQFYAGMALIGAGAALTLAPYDDDKTPFYIAGGAFALTGAIISIASHIHIKRAGILLDKATIETTNKGLTLKYTW